MVNFIIERAAGRTAARMTVDAPLLRIGRGTNADLRSDNPAVAFDHAVIEADRTGYAIRDSGSITGTYVNGKAIESVHLNRGDRIEIGDLRIEVEDADPSHPLLLRLVPQRAAAGPAAGGAVPARGEKGRGEIAAPVIDYAAAFSLRRSYLTKVTVAGLLVLATLAVVGQVTKSEHQRAFMPGGLASAHARMRIPCEKCHTPFRPVSDSQCQDCHRQPGHGQRERPEPSCASCHAEHRGQMMLAMIPDGRCGSCHATLEPAVTSFAASHPEFTPEEDPDELRFNHQLHLRPSGVRDGAGQTVQLQCEACHLAPVRFETHCRDCHRLTFDPRFPRTEIPHGGDPSLVYGFIMAAYAGDPDLMSRTPTELRRIMATRQHVPSEHRAMLNAEQVIKTKCRYCHEEMEALIRRRWLTTAKFSHDRHAQIGCEDCHAGVRTSSKTADVLLPAKKDCTRCHGAEGNMVSSACVTCHVYHRAEVRR